MTSINRVILSKEKNQRGVWDAPRWGQGFSTILLDQAIGLGQMAGFIDDNDAVDENYLLTKVI